MKIHNKILLSEIDYLNSLQIREIKVFNQITINKILFLRKTFMKNGYFLAKKILSKELCELCQSIIIFDNSTKNDDRQFYRNHNVKNDNSEKLISIIHEFLNKLFSLIMNRNLFNTYSFAMNYIKGSDMDPHYDLLLNSISATVVFKGSNSYNPIFIDKSLFGNPYTHRLTIKDKSSIPVENIIELNADFCDIVCFRGREHLHWRNKINFDEDYRAFLVHFTDYSFNGKILQAPTEFFGIKHQLIDLNNYIDFRNHYAMFFDPTSKY